MSVWDDTEVAPPRFIFLRFSCAKGSIEESEKKEVALFLLTRPIDRTNGPDIPVGTSKSQGTPDGIERNAGHSLSLPLSYGLTSQLRLRRLYQI